MPSFWDIILISLLAIEVLGKGAMEMGVLLNKSEDDMDKLTETMEKYGIVLDEETVKANAKFTASFAELKLSMGALTKDISLKVLPSLTKISTGISDLILGKQGGLQVAKEGIEEFSDSLVNLLPELSKRLLDLVDVFVKVAPELLKSVLEAIEKSLPTLLDATIKLLKLIINVVIENLPLIVAMVLEITLAIAKEITKMLPKLIPSLIDIIMKIVNFILDDENIDLFVDAGVDLMLGLLDGFFIALPKILEKLPEIVAKIAYAFIKLSFKFEEIGKRIVASIFKGILRSFISMMLKISPGGMLDGFREKLSATFNSAMDDLHLDKNLEWTMSSDINRAGKNKYGNTYNNSSYTENYQISSSHASPDEIARNIRMQKIYGLAGAR